MRATWAWPGGVSSEGPIRLISGWCRDEEGHMLLVERLDAWWKGEDNLGNDGEDCNNWCLYRVESGKVGIACGLFPADMSQWVDASCWSSQRLFKFWLPVFGWGVQLQGGTIWWSGVQLQGGTIRWSHSWRWKEGRCKKQLSPGAVEEEKYLVEFIRLTNRKWRLAALRAHTSWPSF